MIVGVGIELWNIYYSKRKTSHQLLSWLPWKWAKFCVPVHLDCVAASISFYFVCRLLFAEIKTKLSVFVLVRMIFVCNRTFVGFSGNFWISIKIFCESGQSMNDGKCYKRWPRSLASLLIVITCTFSILVHIKHISYRWQRCDWEWNFVILFILFFVFIFMLTKKVSIEVFTSVKVINRFEISKMKKRAPNFTYSSNIMLTSAMHEFPFWFIQSPKLCVFEMFTSIA